MDQVRGPELAKLLGLPQQRFTFECPCGKGTNDATEFERHVAGYGTSWPACKRVLPQVAAMLRKQVDAGKSVAVVPPAKVGRKVDKNDPTTPRLL